MDVHTKTQRSFNMSRVKSKNTKPEILMFSMLRKSGYEFRRHYPIAGKPDIAFPKLKIAVFIDGEFWHGKDFNVWKEKLSPFWLKKIGENIKRDRRSTRELRSRGWRIIRFWDKRISRNPERSLIRLMHFVDQTKSHR